MIQRLVYADPSLVNQKVGAGRLTRRLAAGRQRWERGVSRRGQEAIGQQHRKATMNTNDLKACLCGSESGKSEGWSRSTKEAPGGGEAAVGEGCVPRRREEAI